MRLHLNIVIYSAQGGKVMVRIRVINVRVRVSFRLLVVHTVNNTVHFYLSGPVICHSVTEQISGFNCNDIVHM